MGKQDLGRRFVILETLVCESNRQICKVEDRLSGATFVAKGELHGASEGFAPWVEQEFSLLRLLSHPLVVTPRSLHRAAWSKGSRLVFDFFVMDWLEGPSLAALPPRQSAAELRTLLQQILELVAWFHTQRRVRLDLKPHHFVMTEVGLRMIDLGTVLEDRPLAKSPPSGTLPYLAPESLAGQDVGPVSDLYSVGAIFYQLVYGDPPPLYGDTPEAHQPVLAATPIPTFPPALGAPDLERLWRGLLARRPEQRLGSADAALAELGVRQGDWRLRAPLPEALPIAREGALEQALEQLHSHAQGEGGRLLIVGPPGAGRSRLMADLAQHLGARGALAVLLVDGGLHPPTPQLLERVSELWMDDGRARGSASLAPGLEVMQRLLGSREGGRGSLRTLLVDGWAGLPERSREILERVAPYAEGSGLSLVVATSGEVPEPLLAWPRVQLGPFGREEVAALGREVLGADLDMTDVECDALVRLSQGRVGELRSLLAARWREPSLTWDTCRPDGPPMDLLIRSGLGDERLRRAAAALAVVWEPFPPAVEVALLGEEGSALALELLHLGVLRQEHDRRSFSEEVVRRGLLYQLDPDEVRRLHRVLAGCYEHLAQLGEPNTLSVRARALLGAGETAAAAHMYWNLLMLEQERGGLEGRREALEGLRRSTGPGTAERCRALLLLAELHIETRQEARALPLLQEAGAAPHTLTEGERLRLRGALALFLPVPSRREEAAAELKEALNLSAGAAGASAVPAEQRRRWLSQLLVHQLRSSPPDLEGARRSLLEYQALLGPESVSDGMYYEAWLLAEEGRKAEATSRLRAALDRVSGAALLAEYKLRTLLARVLADSGEQRAAEEQAERTVALARRLLVAEEEARALNNAAEILSRRRPSEQLGQYLRQAAELYCRVGRPPQELRARLALVEMLLDAGGADERARSELAAAEGLLAGPCLADRHALLRRDVLKGVLDARKEDDPASTRALEELEQRVRAARDAHLVVRVLLERAAVAIREGAFKDARALLADVRGLDVLRQSGSAARRLAELDQRLSRSLNPEGVGEEGLRSLNEAWFGQLVTVLSYRDDPERFVQEIATLAGRLLGGWGIVVLVRPGQKDDTAYRGHNITDEMMSYSRTLMEEVKRTRKRIVLLNVHSDPRSRLARSLREGMADKAIIVEPILHQGELVGALQMVVPELSGSQEAAVRITERAAELTRGALCALRPWGMEPTDLREIIGTSRLARELRERVWQLTRSTRDYLTVLLLGPTGTGKTHLAQLLHQRRFQGKAPEDHPLIHRSVAELGESMGRASLFGVVSKWATQVSATAGWLEDAEQGTLFLDEIGDTPEWCQPVLLGALSEGRFERQGASRTLYRDLIKRDRKAAAEHDTKELMCNLFFATRRNLEQLVQQEKFREDLLYRITENVIWMPTLRECGEEDILLHLDRQLKDARLLATEGSSRLRPSDLFEQGALEYLSQEHPWHGNIREMKKFVGSELLRHRVMEEGRRRINRTEVLRFFGLQSVGTPPWRWSPPASPTPARPTEGSTAPPPTTQAPGSRPWWRPSGPPYLTREQIETLCEYPKASYHHAVWQQCGNNATQAAAVCDTSRQRLTRYVESLPELEDKLSAWGLLP